MWQAVAAVAAMLTAIVGAGLGIAGFVRSAASSAAQTGLDYMREALASQQKELTRQQGEIGELRGQLTDCRDERHAMAVRLAELEERMP